MADTSSGGIPPQPRPTPPTQALQAWTVLASTGTLVLSQSAQEYAVYDQQTTFGRWPLTEEGYRFAIRTYEAHKQSFVHGIAYQATGYQDPERLGLPTEPVLKPQSYASPMSYVGSTRRISAWASRTAKRSPAFGVLGWTLGIFAMLFMWVFLLFWYLVVFYLFGVFTIPYRLMRRSQRKSLHVQKTALATQQAMFQQLSPPRHAVSQQPSPQYPPVTGQAPPPPAIPPPSS